MACTTRRAEKPSSTLLKAHGSGAAQQNTQKVPDLRPALLPYCLTMLVQAATAPKAEAP